MIKLYKDKKWLYQKYINEKLSANKIGKLCGIFGIGYWLKKYNILIRSRSEANHLSKANHCNLSEEASEWINGELLGDGCLFSESIYSASFRYQSKYIEYIKYISDTLNSFGIKQSGKIIKNYNKKYGNCSYYYSSCSYVELYPIRKQWYPEGKKIIPKDIILTPLTCRQWYIGDGNLKHYKEKKRPSISLATCGFSILDVEWLITQLFKLGFKITRWPISNIIGISTYSTKEFLEYIGHCPTKCYKYKWAY